MSTSRYNELSQSQVKVFRSGKNAIKTKCETYLLYQAGFAIGLPETSHDDHASDQIKAIWVIAAYLYITKYLVSERSQIPTLLVAKFGHG